MNSSKRVSSIIIAALLVAVSFFFGFNSGKHSVSPESLIVSLENKDIGATTTADFAPFWKAWNILNNKFAGTSTSDQERVWGAIEGMTASLGDPYTTFFPPVESEIFKTEIAGNFEGVGMEVGVKDGKLVVVTPLKDTPAEKAGIRPGDFILKIDDTDSITLTTDAAVKLIRGKRGTVVKLVLLREGSEEPITVSVTRTTINLPTVDTKLSKEGIFTISLYSFSANSANLFRNALKEFISSGTKKLVLDLRGNPGGYLDAAVDMASWFLPSGKVIVREEFGKSGENVKDAYRSKGYNIFESGLRMVILVDEGSASASEILAGALSEHGVATLVGTQTFGKGSVQELIPITSDTSLKVTIAQWLTPNGVSISEKGITPDHVVELTAEDIKAKRDPQMNKAVELLLAN